MMAGGAALYTAFPSGYEASASGAVPHRHGDAPAHVHTEADVDRVGEHAVGSAVEQDPAVRHAGLHAHDGQVHVHGDLAHTHAPSPEAAVTRRAMDAAPARREAEPTAPVREGEFAERPRRLAALSSPSVETPPPIGRG